MYCFVTLKYLQVLHTYPKWVKNDYGVVNWWWWIGRRCWGFCDPCSTVYGTISLKFNLSAWHLSLHYNSSSQLNLNQLWFHQNTKEFFWLESGHNSHLKNKGSSYLQKYSLKTEKRCKMEVLFFSWIRVTIYSNIFSLLIQRH